MNILDLQDKLKNFSQEQLIQEMQMPTGQLPQFLLLSEITRRKKMQDSYAQQQDQAQEQTTVAQDAINAAGIPQGEAQQLAGTMAPQTDMAGNTGAMSQLVQGMAGGGIVAMQDGGLIDSRSGLERMEQEQATSRLMSTSPTIRALRLSEIGGNIGDFVNEVGLNAIRQADALVAAGASLGGRTAAAGTAALGALASVLGFPDTGAMIERTANTLAQKRSAMMKSADGERMPFGLLGGRVFTSSEQTPFTVPQETRNLYTQADVLRRLGNTPDDSMLFAEGLPNEQLSQQYSLLPGSTGLSPRAGVMAEMPNLMQSDPRPLDRLREPLPTSPGYFSAPDAPLAARPSPLPTFDVSTGVPLSVEEVEAAVFPTQADLNFRGAEPPENDRFPGETRVEAERQAALEAANARDAAQKRQNLDAFLSHMDKPLPTGVDAAIDFVGNLVERANLYGQDKAKAAAGTPPKVLTPGEDTVRPRARPDGLAKETTPPGPPGPPGPSGGGIASVARGAAAPSNFEQELLNMLGAREKRATQDKFLALAQAGMALMSSKQPTFGGALGEAGASGLAALREGQAGSEADRLALLGQIEKSRMGREKLDLERQALAARNAAGSRGRGPTLSQLNAYAQFTSDTLDALTGGRDPSILITTAAGEGKNQLVMDIQAAVAEDAAARTAYTNAMGAIGGVDPNFFDASANEE